MTAYEGYFWGGMSLVILGLVVIFVLICLRIIENRINRRH